MLFTSCLTQSLKDEGFQSPASSAKTGSSPSSGNMFTSSLLDGSHGRAVDHHPDHHNWSSGNAGILPLSENRLPFALSAQAAKVGFIMWNIDFGSLGDITMGKQFFFSSS